MSENLPYFFLEARTLLLILNQTRSIVYQIFLIDALSAFLLQLSFLSFSLRSLSYSPNFVLWLNQPSSSTSFNPQFKAKSMPFNVASNSATLMWLQPSFFLNPATSSATTSPISIIKIYGHIACIVPHPSRFCFMYAPTLRHWVLLLYTVKVAYITVIVSSSTFIS